MRIGAGGADDQVGEAVAVDVAGRGDRDAAVVACRHAAELEAVGCRRGWRGRDWRRSPPPCRTPHSSRRNVLPCGSAPYGADDQVGEAVAVDVAGRGDRAAAEVVGRHAAELEAVGAVETQQDRNSLKTDMTGTSDARPVARCRRRVHRISSIIGLTRRHATELLRSGRIAGRSAGSARHSRLVDRPRVPSRRRSGRIVRPSGLPLIRARGATSKRVDAGRDRSSARRARSDRRSASIAPSASTA